MAGKEKINLPALGQVGVVVKDLDKTIEFYSSTFGIGPWRIIEADYHDVMVHGKKCSYRVRLAFADMGPVELELIESISGESIYADFLKSGKEGLHHLCFVLSKEDKDRIVANLGEHGIDVIQGANSRVHSGSYAYMGTDKIGGIIFEFVNRPPGWDKSTLAAYKPLKA